ncbi:hypothetical protein DPMN_133535 [Dreissena polymorpha]|uniref:Uncharacterized protein n=1 Tax=Dreissena polymorpha TaxID=45954 RepID=A0A9D4FUI5_DREPO|nr:hypothetical protein DPMN_133535 [Dreissena polymorpha]
MGQLDKTITYEVNISVCRFVVFGDSMYVSDDNNNMLSALTPSGELLRTFCTPDLISPCGMTVLVTRQLIVCGRNSTNLVLLNTNTGETRKLYGELGGINKPSTLCFKLEGSKLFVLPDCYNVISVRHVILDADELTH